MATFETIVHLAPAFLGERERTLVEHGPLSASGFRFASGVCGLRLANELGQLVMLPFQGQQIWSAAFHGRELTMRSMFEAPRLTDRFLETFGGFLVHCGATAMGGPSREDTHPLHGELPNAPYQEAYLVVGQDEKGPYIGLGGRYRHQVFFSHDYVAEPLVKLYAGSTLLHLSMTIVNLKNSDMELMYLAHVNYRPVDHGRLVYSAPCTPRHVRVRTSIPSHIRPQAGYAEFIAELEQHPERHHLLAPGMAFDPEVVFFIDYLADAEGWAHSMQVHPDGSADYVAHRPDQLPKATRWISRTPDQDAMAIVEPGTAEPEGYLAEKAKGNLWILPPGQFRCQIVTGMLAAEEARRMEVKIEQIVEEWKDGRVEG